jgi:hypothetical protein
MPWAGGVFSRTNGLHTGTTVWAQDAAAGIGITTGNHDTHDQDIAGGGSGTAHSHTFTGSGLSLNYVDMILASKNKEPSLTPQIPDGPDHLDCPLHRRPMAKVCKKCPWWKQIRGRDVNTGSQVDQWDCAISFLPMLMIEAAAQARSGAAATESFRNDMVRMADSSRQIRRTHYKQIES